MSPIKRPLFEDNPKLATWKLYAAVLKFLRSIDASEKISTDDYYHMLVTSNRLPFSKKRLLVVTQVLCKRGGFLYEEKGGTITIIKF